MSVTIYEALENANINIRGKLQPMQLDLAKEQLNNAVVLLRKGYGVDEEMGPLLEKYGTVDKVPQKPEPEKEES